MNAHLSFVLGLWVGAFVMWLLWMWTHHCIRFALRDPSSRAQILSSLRPAPASASESAPSRPSLPSVQTPPSPPPK